MRTVKYAALVFALLSLVSCQKKNRDIPVKKIIVEPNMVVGVPGDTFPIRWSFSPENATNTDALSIRVNPPTLGTFQDGVLTLKGVGSGGVVFMCGSSFASCGINSCYGSFSISGTQYYAESMTGMLVYSEPGVASYVLLTANSSDQHHAQIIMNSTEFGKTYDLTKPIPEVAEYDSFIISSFLNNNEEFRSVVWYHDKTAVALNNLWEEQDATVTSGTLRVDQDPTHELYFKIALELTMSDGYSLKLDWDGLSSAKIDRYY